MIRVMSDPSATNQTSTTQKVIPSDGRPERIVGLYTEVSPSVLATIAPQLLSMSADTPDPIVLHISSPGGCVASGLALVDVMQHVTAPVFTIGIGMVASMGAVILAAGEPGHRYALKHTRIMLHGTTGGGFGKLDEIKAATLLQQQFEREIEDVLLSNCHLSRVQLQKVLRKERFLMSREARDIGLIDHIL